MRPISAWLTARPWNGILGLALTLLLPFAPLLSGAVMVLLMLAAGPQRALTVAVAAGAMLGVLFFAFGNPVVPLLVNAAGVWLPAALFGAVLGRTRSLTLTLQVSVILAIGATLAFFVVLGDPTPFWTVQLEAVSTWFREAGLTQQADVLLEQRELIAPQMTMLFVFTTWSLWVLVLVLGYALYQQLPERRGVFGRFCDLHFGRVLALTMAVASLTALVVSAAWLQNVAFVLFVVFWLQGLAFLHWLHAEGPLPVALLIGVYALLPFLNALLVMLLAVLGYTDAWFDYRPRIAAARRAGK